MTGAGSEAGGLHINTLGAGSRVIDRRLSGYINGVVEQDLINCHEGRAGRGIH